jgi:DNA-binding response OmpR family regulator
VKNAGATILVVEDNEDDVFFFERALKEAGFQVPVHVVTNGEQAMRYLEGTGEFSDRARFAFPVFVFLDLKLPFVDGFEVLQWMRREKRLEVPVAVLTSSPEEKDMRKARELGASCYLIKPPTREMLVSCWRQFDLPTQHKHH